MRNVAKKGILTAVATGSVLASTAGYAYAGAEAQGVAAGSPGVASGNSVQVPVEVPVNACGNTVDVIGALNPAFGNRCANASGRHAAPQPAQGGQSGQPGAGTGASSTGGNRGTTAGSSASGTAAGSPGVLSGNSVQAPVHIPVNACGNSVDVVGAANPAFGNSCGTVAHPAPAPAPGDDCPEGHTPPPGDTPGTSRGGGPSEGVTPAAPAVASSGATVQAAPAAARTAAAATAPGSQLASTGAGGVELLGAAGLALLLGGGVLYRRSRAGAR
ncbi:chaplin [Kitasatospora sp. NPDC101183]|uniref:chaplin n=1 Tax=Kitasatospora sp. NPDC101183 TaxID=3364100 RepID=UPI0037F71610